jgi:hypothetical protein
VVVVVDNEVRVVVVVLVKVEDEVEVDDLLVECCEEVGTTGESEVGDTGDGPCTCAVHVCRRSCSGWFVVLLVVVEVIVVTVVVDADVVGGACMRIEGELVDVEVDEQSNEVWGSVTGEVGVRIAVRESRRGCSSSLDALRFFDVMVSCLVGRLSFSLSLLLPPLGVLSTTVVRSELIWSSQRSGGDAMDGSGADCSSVDSVRSCVL